MAFDLQFVDSIGQIYDPITDTFSRTVADGWGTSDSGHAWTTSGGAASDYSVSSGQGHHSLGSVNVFRRSTAGSGIADVDITCNAQVPVLATGAAIAFELLARFVDGSNLYYLQVRCNTNQSMGLRFVRVVGGTTTIIATLDPHPDETHQTNDNFAVRFQVVGSLLRAKLWHTPNPEPASWDLTFTDPTPHMTAGGVGCRSSLFTGNTNTLPVTINFDNFAAGPLTQVRLDLNDDLPWRTLGEGTEFGTPPLRRAVASTLMQDGEHVSAAAYGNRMLTLTLDCQLPDTDFDGAAAAFQTLSRELDRPGNFLRYRPGTTQPVFFRTLRSDFNAVVWDAVLRRASVSVLAEPFAYGLRETLPSVTVYNDPAEGTTSNANPYFETDVANWTATGGTFVRSTAQFHQGVASGLLTPDGVSATSRVTSNHVAASAGIAYRGSAWVRCATARNVQLEINWYDAGNVFLSSSSTGATVVANTWTLLDFTATAPGGTGFAAVQTSMYTTPPITDLLYVDEARLRQSGGPGGMCLDITGVKGDVESPLYLTADTAGVISGITTWRRKTALAIRRRGTPSQVPYAVQCESLDPDFAGDTAVSSAHAGASGGSHMRTTFTSAVMAGRFGSAAPFPASVDARGTYRVYVRVAQTVASDVIVVQLNFNDPVTLPTSLSTSWKYVDLGLIQLPPGYADTEDGVSGVETPTLGLFVHLLAQRVSGTGSLDWDVLLIMPADDRLLLLTWPGIAGPSTGATNFVIDSNRGEVYGLGSSGERFPTDPVEPEGGFPMVSPAVTNRVYFARDVGWETAGIGETGPGDDITGATSVGVYYWPRHITTRPTS